MSNEQTYDEVFHEMLMTLVRLRLFINNNACGDETADVAAILDDLIARGVRMRGDAK